VTTENPENNPLVDADWLAAHYDEVAVVDVRWRIAGPPGRDAYRDGHLPGAHFLDIDTDLAGHPSLRGGRHPLPSPEAFATTLGRLGIDEDRRVVAYDDASGSTAARLWWLLTSIGQPAAVLDGGIATWPGPLDTEIPTPVPVARPTRPWPVARFVDVPGVQTAIKGGVVLDARTTARYERGDPAIDPCPGHIPGARTAPWSENVDPSSGRLLPVEVLRARYDQLGVTEDGPIVAYCGSGVTACHDLLALAVAGIMTGALYTGSWSAWGADPDRPVATGPDRAPMGAE
jgi:thiosulfate/3-mercaptopyruvate sulfurtransferase